MSTIILKDTIPVLLNRLFLKARRSSDPSLNRLDNLPAMPRLNQNTSGTHKTEGNDPKAILLQQPTWSFSGSPPAEGPTARTRESSLPISTQGATQKQQDASRSSAPPDCEMEVDQQGQASQDFETRSQPPSGDPSEESVDSEMRDEVEHAEANGHPASHSNDPANPHDSGAQDDQPSSTHDRQRDATPGHQTPPSGQESTAVEEAPVDPKELLEPYEWDDLEERFLKKMEECQIREEGIEKEFREWIQVNSSSFRYLPKTCCIPTSPSSREITSSDFPCGPVYEFIEHKRFP